MALCAREWCVSVEYKLGFCVACQADAVIYSSHMCKRHHQDRSTRHEPRVCPVVGCDDLQSRHSGGKRWLGFCIEHYRQRVAENPGGGRRKIADGDKKQIPSGYVMVMVNGKWVAEHRVVMENVVGRPLMPHENVHHRNGLRDDNSIENLELWVSPPRFGRRAEDVTCANCGTSYMKSVTSTRKGNLDE